MDSAELRSALKDAGLSKYQSAAYTSLLDLGSASATELADASEVPGARIYDVLRDLEAEGYVETFEGDTLRARARDPGEALTDLRDRAEQLADAADEIEKRWEQPELDQHRVDIVKRFDTVFDRAREAIANAENEVQVAVTPEGFERLRDALASAHDNGAIVKVTINTGDEETAPIPDARAFEGVATEVRHRTLPTPFVALVDRSTTRFAPHRDSLNQYGVLVDDNTLTYVFHWYFDTCLWEVWDVVYDARPDDPPRSYANVRRFVRDAEPLLQAGDRIEAKIEGTRPATGERVTVSGVVTDLTYGGTPSNGGGLPLAQLAGQVTVRVDDGSHTWSIGGWGAVIEDIEATRLTVTSVTTNGRVGEADAV